jgi:hypothetical protein
MIKVFFLGRILRGLEFKIRNLKLKPHNLLQQMGLSPKHLDSFFQYLVKFSLKRINRLNTRHLKTFILRNYY